MIVVATTTFLLALLAVFHQAAVAAVELNYGDSSPPQQQSSYDERLHGISNGNNYGRDHDNNNYDEHGGNDEMCVVNPTGKRRGRDPMAKLGTMPKTIENSNFATANKQKFREQFEAVDFTFDVFKKLSEAKVGGGGHGTIVSVADVPALKDEGVAMVYFELEPCGLILPHAHPRATELIYAVDAEKLQVGFLEETNSRFIVNEITTGQMAFVPQGLLHYSQNVGCSKLVMVGFFNHENPGGWFASLRLFDTPIEVVSAALDIDEHLAQKLRDGLPDVSPVKGRASCLQKCQLPHDYQSEKYSNLQALQEEDQQHQPPSGPYEPQHKRAPSPQYSAAYEAVAGPAAAPYQQK